VGSEPRVSVVVPTWNRLALLDRALAAVEAQEFRDFEVIVVDDASTDGTAEWIRARRPDVHLIASPARVGAAAARNLALARARGEFVAFLDDDDVWRPGYLAAQAAHLDANPAATLSYADHVEVDPDGRSTRPDTGAVLPHASPLVRLLAESHIHTMSVVVCRREAVERFGPLDEQLSIVHDLEWYARLVAGGRGVARLPRLLTERQVPGGLVSAHRDWFREERALHDAIFARQGLSRIDRRMIRTCRALFFARTALGKGDLAFGLARLGEAAWSSPRWTFEVAARRVLRRAHADRRAPGELPTSPAEAGG
jgi:glycosyltransferase involved in cell wall biosynthesis